MAQIFHWVTAIVALLAFADGLGGSEQLDYLPSCDFEEQPHETLGMIVLRLTGRR